MNTNIKMYFSIIIPTCNRSDDLRRALESILIQTITPEEIIIIDQSDDQNTKRLFSTFDTKFKEKDIKGIYLYQQEKNSAMARNFGISKASGEIISFLDDDVILCDDYFEKIIFILKTI
jgi:glycosyltransferase involved in cell wall biosynthesis